MKQMTVSQFYCFVLLLFSAFALGSSLSIIPDIKDHVRITNNFINKSFGYQCKSRDNVIGPRTLQPKGQWEFSFGPDWFHQTYFNCHFWYEHFTSTFDVYSSYLKQEVNGKNFFWTVQDDGFYLYHPMLGKNLRLHVWTSIYV